MIIPYFIVSTIILTVAAVKKERTFAVMRFNGKPDLVRGRMDPIVTPGKISGHVHSVQGGNAFAIDMPGNTASTKSTCTTAKIKNDNSNYWFPSLYFHHEENGTFTAVDLFYVNVYYFFEATDDDIVPFPEGFRMVSGNAMKRSAPTRNTGEQNLDPANGEITPVQFTCPFSPEKGDPPRYSTNDGTKGVGLQDPNNKGAGIGFPDAQCNVGGAPLRADVHFPSCYNPAIGPTNFTHNTQFPTSKGAKNGANCPEGWLHLPHLFIETYWDTPKFNQYWTPGQGKQPFVLSNGDPTGYGLHADFLNGWDTQTLQKIIETCDAGDSGMDKCPQIIGGLTDENESCKIDNPVNEQVIGNLDKLPGCNPLSYGPEDAVMCSNSTIIDHSSSSSSFSSSTTQATSLVTVTTSNATTIVDSYQTVTIIPSDAVRNRTHKHSI